MENLPSEILSHIYGFDPTFRIYFKNHILREIECLHSKCLCRSYSSYASLEDCRKNSFRFSDKNGYYIKFAVFEEIEWNVFNIQITDALSGKWTSCIKKFTQFPYRLYLELLKKNTSSSFDNRLTCKLTNCICNTD